MTRDGETPEVAIRIMTLADYDAVMALWGAAEGVKLRRVDTREAIGRYLDRNPGTSFVAWAGPRCVGAVLSGHDGRRGYLHHLAVAGDFRGRGLGTRLASRCLEELARIGVEKIHAFVLADNLAAQRFWARIGWMRRDDVVFFSAIASDEPEA
jgi:ribosomal protein S18 acetylase RimI-like enzyme